MEFKNSRNTWFTSSLFWETCYDKDDAVYTFAPESFEHNGKTIESFYKLYVSYCKEDPSEHNLAVLTLGGWEHWQVLNNSEILKPYFEKLRDEVSIILKKDAMAYLVKEVQTEGKNAYQSARYLLDKGIIQGGPVRKRRQKNDELNKKVSQDFKDDAKRLGLKVVE